MDPYKPAQVDCSRHRRMSKTELMERLHALQNIDSNERFGVLREAELQTVLQELEVYQIELEMQNRELRESQQALEESQDRFVNLYDYAPMGYVSLTDQGLIHEINLTAASMIGIERQWLIGRSLAPWIIGANLKQFREHLKKSVAQASALERKVTTTLHLSPRNKLAYPVEFSSVCVVEALTDTPLIRTTLTDLSERVKMEDSLREAVEKLKEERELRERFVSMLTHDLRTPLTAARINAQRLGSRSNDPEALKKTQKQLLKSIDRIDGMIQDLLDANRIQAGESLSMNFTEFDLAELVKTILNDLSASLGDRFLLRAPARVLGKWSQEGLRRVVENLLNNAVKYGDFTHPITVSVSADDLKQEVILSVQNFGNPIPADELSSLFQQYRRAPEAEKGLQKGWGIGLTLVKGVVESHSGRISVESNLVDGTTFRVVLPYTVRASAQRSVRASAQQ